MFSKVSSVLACIISSSNFLFTFHLKWSGKYSWTRESAQLPSFSLIGNASFMENIYETFCKTRWCLIKQERNIQVFWLQMGETKIIKKQMSTKQPHKVTEYFSAATQEVCAPVTNYIMAWSLLASSHSTCVFNPCNLIQRQRLLKAEGMLKDLLLHSRFKESLQFLQVATFCTTYFF